MPARTTQDSSSIGSSSHFVTYAGAVADTDLIAEGAGAACRKIRSNTTGVLVVQRAGDETPVTLHFLAGESQEVNCSALVAANSTVTDITVYW